MSSDFDIVIVGAGAAGLAAAVRLAQAPVTVQVLEARDRIGGRAQTVMAAGLPVDLGCGWLHSADRNVLSVLAEPLGFPLDQSPPHWTRQAANADFSAADQRQFAQALQELEARVEAARGAADQAVSALMDPGGKWNPLLNAFSAYYNGAEFDQISIHDYAAYDDSEVNWRTPRGYGALIAAFGAKAPVKLGARVTRIEHGGGRIRLETTVGALQARAVIVTAPTPTIASGELAFSPDLPPWREAAAALPLGLADKVFLAVDEAESLPAESHLFGDPHRTATGSYHLRPFGRPLIEAFFGGAHARALEAEGPGATARFAIDELTNLLGAGFRGRLTAVAASAWAGDPWARGAYSHAVPGGAWAREALGRVAEERILFAGEAVSPHAFSTAHGAAESGARAAERALELLGGPG